MRAPTFQGDRGLQGYPGEPGLTGTSGLPVGSAWTPSILHAGFTMLLPATLPCDAGHTSIINHDDYDNDDDDAENVSWRIMCIV